VSRHIKTIDSPGEALMAFLESTYEAAATAARWDRKALEQTFVP